MEVKVKMYGEKAVRAQAHDKMWCGRCLNEQNRLQVWVCMMSSAHSGGDRQLRENQHFVRAVHCLLLLLCCPYTFAKYSKCLQICEELSIMFDNERPTNAHTHTQANARRKQTGPLMRGCDLWREGNEIDTVMLRFSQLSHTHTRPNLDESTHWIGRVEFLFCSRARRGCTPEFISKFKKKKKKKRKTKTHRNAVYKLRTHTFTHTHTDKKT